MTKRDYTLHVYTLGEGNCYLVVLMLVVTIFIKLLCFGYFSSSPWSSMTPQATRPPAFPVFLLPSSASPVPLQETNLKFGIWYAGKLSLIASWISWISILESISQIWKPWKVETYTPRSSEPACITMARPAMSLNIGNQQIRNINTTVLFQDWSKPTSLPHRQGWEFCQRGQCWFPQKEALQCSQGHQHGSPWHRKRESPGRKKLSYSITLWLSPYTWPYSHGDLMHHWPNIVWSCCCQ